ncbi:hypothetical protein Tco_0583267 [Tanacetum coccineum]
MDDLDNGNLDVYESKLSYDDFEKMYAKVVIFINKRFVRLIDVTVEQCLDLKYGDHTMVSTVVNESMIAMWLIQSYKKQFDEYMEIKKQKENVLWIYWARGDDEKVITYDELSNLGDGNLIKENEIAQIFRIDTDIFHFETPLCEAFKEFNYLLKIYVDWPTCNWKKEKYYNGGDLPRVIWSGDVTYFKSYEWYENLGEGELKYKALNSKAIFVGSKGVDEEPRINNDYETQTDERRFDDHKLMRDDDVDIGDLEEYLIRKDPPYYVNEEEERYKERRCKLFGIPYVKPSTCKLEKFKVVKYSFRPVEEYVIIKEYEYDIWVQTEENISRVYQDIFQKKDEGCNYGVIGRYGVSVPALHKKPRRFEALYVVPRMFLRRIEDQVKNILEYYNRDGSDNEDSNEHIEKFLDIFYLFHIPNITQDQVTLRAFPMSLTGAASRWLRNEPAGLIKTWETVKEKILSKYCPPAKTAKKIEEINNFQQDPDETLHQAWERFKELLLRCPQHYITYMQEVILFYKGSDVPTRQILDSKGAIPSMKAADAKKAIQEMANHSQKWHNGMSTRCRSTETFDGLAAIQPQLNNLGKEIKKVNKKVYAAQVGCELCNGPHYTKDRPLKEEGKKLEEAYYTQFGVPFQQEGQYKAAAPGFYQ